MTQVVADEVLGKIARQQNDLFRRVREGSLDPEKTSKGLQALIEKHFDFLPIFSQDMFKKGWKVIKNAQLPWPISIAELELVSFLKGKENYITSIDMAKRAKELEANLGQCHAEYLLKYQKEIPAEWKKFHLAFPGTIWRDPDGNLYVPILYCNKEGMCRLDFEFFNDDFWWNFNDRLVRPRQ